MAVATTTVNKYRKSDRVIVVVLVDFVVITFNTRAQLTECGEYFAPRWQVGGTVKRFIGE